MSENGPREGTRDMVRPGPDAGRRAVDEDSTAGVAYGAISRSFRRRRAELAALMEAGGTADGVAKSYGADHPLEPVVTTDEIEAAVVEAKVSQRATRIEEVRRNRVRKPGTSV